MYFIFLYVFLLLYNQVNNRSDSCLVPPGLCRPDQTGHTIVSHTWSNGRVAFLQSRSNWATFSTTLDCWFLYKYRIQLSLQTATKLWNLSSFFSSHLSSPSHIFVHLSKICPFKFSTSHLTIFSSGYNYHI